MVGSAVRQGVSSSAAGSVMVSWPVPKVTGQPKYSSYTDAQAGSSSGRVTATSRSRREVTVSTS